MTTFQNAGLQLIHSKDLMKDQLCLHCQEPMIVKQLNLTEACRTCFNKKCCDNIAAVPEVEYIQRCYKDMKCEMITGQGFPNPPTSLEEEMKEINKFFYEVETLVQHRLSAELKQELKSLTWTGKQQQDLSQPVVSAVSGNQQKGQKIYFNQLGDKVMDEPTISHIGQAAHFDGMTSCVSEELKNDETPQLEEMLAPQNQSTCAETSAVMINVESSFPGLNGVDMSSCSTYMNENYSLPVNALDSFPNFLWQGENTETKSSFESILMEGKSMACAQNSEISNFETPTSFNNSSGGCDDYIPLVSGELLLSTSLNAEPKIGGKMKGKSSPNKGFPSLSTLDKKEDFCVASSKDSVDSVKKFDIEQEVENDFDASAKLKNIFVCYQPRRYNQKIKPQVNVVPHLDTKSSTPSGSLVSDISFIWQSEKPECSESINAPPVHQLTSPYQQFQVVDSFSTKNTFSTSPALQPSTTGLPLGILEVKRTKEDSAQVKKSIRTNVKAPKKSLQKKNKFILVGDLPTAQEPALTMTDVPKVTRKPVLGFSELKNFGGAKCSLPSEETERKVLKQAGKAKKKSAGKKEVLNSVDDVIEGAIAKIKDSDKKYCSNIMDLLSGL